MSFRAKENNVNMAATHYPQIQESYGDEFILSPFIFDLIR